MDCQFHRKNYLVELKLYFEQVRNVKITAEIRIAFPQ